MEIKIIEIDKKDYYMLPNGNTFETDVISKEGLKKMYLNMKNEICDRDLDLIYDDLDNFISERIFQYIHQNHFTEFIESLDIDRYKIKGVLNF